MRNDIWAYVAGIASGSALTMLGLLVVMLVNPLTTKTNPEAIAGTFGVSIVWGGTELCASEPDAQGCFAPGTPTVIYVAGGLDAETTRQVVLHELGHVVQWRLGLEFSECGADTFAESLGGAPADCR